MSDSQEDLHSEEPPFSRLFVLGDKRASEQDYINEFSRFGTVQYVKLVRDRKTGEVKGLVYIKMAKTSDAAKAVEKLNGCPLTNFNRPMKVLIASNRSAEFSQTDEEIIAQLSRLFVIVPKVFTEEQIQKSFEKFGHISKVVIIREKNTGASKGLAYVTFSKASEAALAYENCDPAYRPKFADPATRKRQHEETICTEKDESLVSLSLPTVERYNPGMEHVQRSRGPIDFLSNFSHQNRHYLMARVSKSMTQMQLTRLFNIVPTLEFCKLMSNPLSATDPAIIKYSSASCCAYAREALNGFEYPPGYPIEVDFHATPDMNSLACDTSRSHCTADPHQVENLLSSTIPRISNEPTSLLAPGKNLSVMWRTSCGSILPPTQSVLETAEMVKRLFIVTQPDRLPSHTLKDLFCRFGNLIHISYMPGKNCGFAKYASEVSAHCAQKFLHGYEVGGIRLKVLDAEDPPAEPIKKQKTLQKNDSSLGV